MRNPPAHSAHPIYAGRTTSIPGQERTAVFLSKLITIRMSAPQELSASRKNGRSRAFGREESLLFARNFFQHPRMLGSLIPSSRFLVDRLLDQIDWTRARTIVEYGPGVGTITGPILDRMEAKSRLVAFEMNCDFVGYLRRIFPDPRLHVVHGSAELVRTELGQLRLSGADYIISGIPYTTMPMRSRETIMRESRAALNPGGAVLVYQFTRAVLPYLRSHFRHVRQDFELRNILPARLFYCTR
jgi:phospholipid N-methyltransferase